MENAPGRTATNSATARQFVCEHPDRRFVSLDHADGWLEEQGVESLVTPVIGVVTPGAVRTMTHSACAQINCRSSFLRQIDQVDRIALGFMARYMATSAHFWLS